MRRRRPLLLETCEDRVLCSVVTHTGDSGAGSLRQAILDANAMAGADTITFSIAAGGVQTISPGSALPTITGSTIIDGTTQPGYAGAPLIEINGAGAGAGANGFTITAGSSTIRGLAVFGFLGDGIVLSGAGATSNTVAGNYVGLRANGTVAANGEGLYINGTASGNTIGGATAADRNVISGNTGDGVQIDGSTNTVRGNFIGTDATGTVDLGNGDDGIDLDSGASSNQILGNLVSGNNSDGIDLGDGGANSANNIIRSNLIGTKADGTTALANSSTGILVGNGSTANGTAIGGATAGDGNTIAFNGAMGVRVIASTGISILGNAITANTNLGIDLGTSGVTANDTLDPDTGANNLQNHPVLTSALRTVSGSTIAGSLNSIASSTFRLEFFANTAVDALGNGEGQRYLGFTNVTTNASGIASFTTSFGATVAVGEFVSATATDSANNTSEFSVNTTAVENPGFWLSTVSTAAATAGGLTAWTDGTAVRFSNPNLALGSGTTNGTFSQIFDVDSFASDGNADINGLHVVGRTVSIGTASPVTVLAGDVLFTTGSAETFGGTAFTARDVIRFRPTVAGDYTAGTFAAVVRSPAGNTVNVRDFALVERATTVGGVVLQPGDFLLAMNTTAYQFDISRFQPTNMATTPTSGTLTEFIDGASTGIGFGQQVYSLALVEQDGMLGGQALQAGQILFSLGAADLVGTNNFSMAQNDLVALTVTATGTGSSSGTGAMIFRGANLGLGNANERSDALALVLSNPPALTMPGAAPTFAEGEAAVAIDATATISDADSADFNGGTLTVTISANAQPEDRLGITHQGTGAGQIGVTGANVTYGGVTIGTFTGGTSGASPLVITFNGNGSPAAAQALLRAITFNNVSDTPSAAARTISVVVTDGDAGTSNAATKTVNVAATNDAPALSVPGAQTAASGVALTISGVSFSDVDAASGNVTVTLNVTAGALTVNSGVAGGLTAGGIAGNGTAAVTLTGTLIAINTTLANATGLQFLSSVSGTQTLAVTINDGGNTGADPSTLGLPASGGPAYEQASSTVAITIPAPSFSVGSPALTEGTDAYAIFTVALSNATTAPVSVDLALAEITATGGSDYGLTLEVSTNGGASWSAATSVTIAAGSTTVLARTPIANDALDENAETFTLTATRTAGTTTNASASGTATIADNDPTPSLAIDDPSVNEAAGTATFTVTLSAASALAVSVAYATNDGTATAGADFTSASGTLNFAAGVTTRTLTVPILNDTIFEGSESFDVILSGAVNAGLADDTGTATIYDDGNGDGGADNDTPALSVGNVTVIEGVDAYAVAVVSLSNPSTMPVDVSLYLSEVTASGNGGDFGSTDSTNLQFSTDGGSTWQDGTETPIAPGSISILMRTPIADDAVAEPTETFIFGAKVSGGNTTNGSAEGTGTIIDDEGDPVLAIGSVTVNEGAGTVTFTVTLSVASKSDIMVDYETVEGTALEGADYEQASNTLLIPGGDLSGTFTVNLLNDGVFEQSESFQVLLSDAVNAVIGVGAGIATIHDDGTGAGGVDDDTPTLSVTDIGPIEADGYAVFAVALSNPSTAPVGVSFALSSGSALGGGTDFGTGGVGNLQVSTDGGSSWTDATAATIAAGSTSVLARAPITNDALDEPDETFTLTATRTAGTTTNANASGTATIADNDAPPAVSISDVTVNESAGSATFTVTLGAASGQTVTVNYATSDGSAQAGIDFTNASGPLSFAPGVTTQTVTIPILDDAIFENAETFSVLLSGTVNATIADAGGVGTIVNEDVPQAALAIVSTSEAATAGNELVVGEVVRFELRFELAEGANAVLTLQHLLPVGLQFVLNANVDVAFTNVATSVTGLAAGSYTNATNDALISASLTADDDAFGDETDVFFKLGTLVNNDSDADREFVTVRFDARVTNAFANQSGATHGDLFAALLDVNADGTPGYVSLDADGDNAATGAEAAADPANDGSGTPGLSNLVTTQVAEPILTLDKQITSAPPAVHPGDTITYAVTIGHAAGSVGTAWEATLSDAAPAGLQITQIDSVTLAGGAQEQSAAAITGGGSGLAGVWDVPAGGSVTVGYRATVTSAAALGSSLSNLANLTWSSLDGVSADERAGGESLFGGGGLNDYAREDAETVLIDSGAGIFTIDKSVVGDLNAQIGERLTYSVVVHVDDGAIGNLSLQDLIPAGLQLVNGSASLSSSAGVIVSGAAFTYAANQLDLGIGGVQSAVDGLANALTVTYQVDMPDVAANDAFGSAATKTNTATASYDPGGGALVRTDNVSVTVVEPRLSLTAGVDDATPHLGQTVAYTLSLAHAAVSSADAHDLIVSDALPAGLTLDASSIVVSGASVVANTSTNGGALSLVLGGLALGGFATIAFRATVTSDPAVIGGSFGGGDDSFTDAANFSYDTQPGTPATGQRTSTGVASSTITVVGADLAVMKDDGVISVTPGGQLTYTIRVTNNGTDAATDVQLTDTLPPGATFNAALSSPGATVGGGTLGFNVASLGAGATQIFTVVLDVNAIAAAGRESLTNSVSVTHDDLEPTSADNTASDTDTLTAAPDYVITKTDGATSAKPGETLTYTITVTNAGNQNGSGVVVSDAFATGIFSSVTASNGGAVNLAAGTVIWNVGDLAAGDSVTLTLIARVKPTFTSIFIPAGTPPGAIPDNNTITNSAGVTDDGAGGADPTPLNNTALDADDLVPVPELKITMRDRVTLVEPGQVFTYTIVATNAGQHESNGMIVTDTLPAGVTFLRATSSDPALSGDAIRSGHRVTWNFAAPVPDNTSVTFTITVRVNADAPASIQLTNVVTIADDGRYGPDAINVADNTARDTNATPAAAPASSAPRAAAPAPEADVLDFRWDGFRNFAGVGSRNGVGSDAPLSGIDTSRPPLLPLMPIYSGEADPGATLAVALFNPKGEQVGAQTVVADAGGNWLATFPTGTLADSPTAARVTLLAAAQGFGEPRGHNLRAFFTPALGAGYFSRATLGVGDLIAGSAPLLDGLCFENPLRLEAGKYGGELLPAAATASGN